MRLVTNNVVFYLYTLIPSTAFAVLVYLFIYLSFDDLVEVETGKRNVSGK